MKSDENLLLLAKELRNKHIREWRHKNKDKVISIIEKWL